MSKSFHLPNYAKSAQKKPFRESATSLLVLEATALFMLWNGHESPGGRSARDGFVVGGEWRRRFFRPEPSIVDAMI
jgi:hypothetical protein